MKTAAWLIALALAVTACGTAEEQSLDTAQEEVTDLANETCPVMGGPVMDGQYTDWNGYRIHFCCAGCDQTFLADPEGFMAVLAEDPSIEADISLYSVLEESADPDEEGCCGGTQEGCSGE